MHPVLQQVIKVCDSHCGIHERNRYMADNSSRLICYYDGSSGWTGYTVEYAKSKSMHVINICDSGRVHEELTISIIKRIDACD